MYFFELLFKRHIESELRDDIVISFLYIFKCLRKIPAFGCGVVAGIEHIRHLCVRTEALARSGGHDISPAAVRFNYPRNLHKLLCFGERCAAELDDL